MIKESQDKTNSICWDYVVIGRYWGKKIVSLPFKITVNNG